MNKFIMKNFWMIKKSDEFKNMSKKFLKDFSNLDEKDIKANLASFLFLDLERRNDQGILDDRMRTIVRKNVKRNYMAQLLNEQGFYRHLNKKTNKELWIQRSEAKSEPIEATMADVAYVKKREDEELREYVNSQLTKKEQSYLIAIEQAKDGAEMADLMGVSETYARKIKERLLNKVKKIIMENREDEVA